ncbi:MAG: hypothetical protein U0704_10535 [Candidatus Eisenbacteria bacterium]
MSEPAGAVAPPAVPRVALAFTVLGLVAQCVGCFVTLPAPWLAVAIVFAAAGAAAVAWATRRWQLALAAVWMAWRCVEPFVLRRPPPPGGATTLLVLVAFGALVLGGAWVGRRGGSS